MTYTNTDLVNDFCKFMRNVGEKNTTKNKEIVARHIKNIEKDYADKHGITQALKVVEKAFADGRPLKVIKNVEIIEHRNKPFANDYPFQKGDQIRVTRYEHGWMNGDMIAKIVECRKNEKGIWSYSAQVIDENGKPYKDYVIEIRHTRDAIAYPVKL